MRWVVGGSLFALGVIIGLGNWVSIISASINKRSVSLVYFFGVGAMLVGICLMPPNLLRTYWWAAFFIDFAAAPILLFMLLSSSARAGGSEKSD